MAFVVDRVDHVVLNCRDVDITVDWYVRVLGMRREVFGDNRIALAFGNQKINVRPTGTPNWETGAVDAPGSLDLCFIAAVSLEEVIEKLKRNNIPVLQGPVAKTGAQGPIRSVYVRDPDLNLIEISELLPQ